MPQNMSNPIMLSVLDDFYHLSILLHFFSTLLHLKFYPPSYFFPFNFVQHCDSYTRLHACYFTSKNNSYQQHPMVSIKQSQIIFTILLSDSN